MEEYDYMDELETEIDGYKLRIRKLLEENERLISENETIKNVRYMINETIYKSRIDKAIEYIENKIEYLNEQKRLITNILTPQNGYLKTDIEIEISKYQELLNILKGDSEND